MRIKVYLVVTTAGDIWEFYVTLASVADITALKSIYLDLPDGATLFVDRAYNHYSFEEELLGDAKIRLIPQRKNRTTRPHEGVVNYLQKTHRKRVDSQ